MAGYSAGPLFKQVESVDLEEALNALKEMHQIEDSELVHSQFSREM